jgi:squalene cyclase
LNILHDFRYNHHFCTFVGELNPSIFCTAHAIHALARTDVVLDEPLMFLLENQYADGRWMADKWHSSWLYTTLEVILALDHSGQSAGVRKAVEALLYHQHSDGGWGMNGKSTNIETAYTVLALFVLEQQAKLPSNAISALKRGKEWLISGYQPFTLNREDKFWIGKELYKPYRIDRMFEITTLLMLAIQETERNLETVY